MVEPSQVQRSAEPPGGPRGGALRESVQLLSFLVFDRLLPLVVWGLLGAVAADYLYWNWASLGFWARVDRCAALLFTAMVLVLFLVRRRRWGPKAGWLGRAVALAGTFVPCAIAWWPRGNLPSPAILPVATVLDIAGLALSIVSLACLGRCFGLFPEVRGLVVRGPYRWVRHPLYLGEMVTALGLVLSAFAWATAALYTAFVALQVWRAFNEERALSAAFPEYRPYMNRTWRLVPWLW